MENDNPDSSAPDSREPARGLYLEDEYLQGVLRVGEGSPERFVALEAHRWMLAGGLARRYPDPRVDAYVRRAETLMHDHARHEELRQRWLTREEYDRVMAEIEEMKRPDYEW